MKSFWLPGPCPGTCPPCPRGLGLTAGLSPGSWSNGLPWLFCLIFSARQRLVCSRYKVVARPGLAPPHLLPPLLLLSEAALSRDRVVKCKVPPFSQHPSGTRSRACISSAIAHQGCVRRCRLGTHARHTQRWLPAFDA